MQLVIMSVACNTELGVWTFKAHTQSFLSVEFQFNQLCNHTNDQEEQAELAINELQIKREKQRNRLLMPVLLSILARGTHILKGMAGDIKANTYLRYTAILIICY